MGTPPFAADILHSLIGSGQDIVAVYAQPPRPAGRGKALKKSAVQQLAETHGVTVHTPLNFTQAQDVAQFEQYGADVAIVAAYGLLLPTALLEAPRFGCVNIHGSLLPRWRGAAPVQYALLKGDPHTGVTLMQMDEGMDTGNIIATHRFDIKEKDDALTLFEKMTHGAIHLMDSALPRYLRGELLPRPQPEEGVTYAPKIPKSMGQLKAAQSAQSLVNQVRAFIISPGSWFMVGDKKIKVLAAKIDQQDDFFAQQHWGITCDDHAGIMTTEGVFRPTVVQPAGKKPMPLRDFLNGYPLPAGTRLLTD